MGKIYRVKAGRKKHKPATVAYVNRAIARSEEKKGVQIDMSTPFASIGATWTEVDATDIDQGDSVATRDGNQVILKSLTLHGVITNGDDTNVMRIIIALWDGRSQTPLATNSATISSSVYKDTPSGKGIIKKYWDHYVTLVAPFTTGTDLKTFDFYKKFKRGIPLIYTGDGTTCSKKLIIGMISDSVAVANPGVTQGFYSVRFTDS